MTAFIPLNKGSLATLLVALARAEHKKQVVSLQGFLKYFKNWPYQDIY